MPKYYKNLIWDFYYLRIIKIVYFDVGDFKYQIETDKFFDVVITINGFILLSLGLAPGLLINMIQNIFSVHIPTKYSLRRLKLLYDYKFNLYAWVYVAIFKK